MDPLHGRIVRLGLAAAAPYGFVLAGGYAVQAHGFLVRPSDDVDLFTNRGETDAFGTAVDAVVAALQEEGLSKNNWCVSRQSGIDVMDMR
jgi:hypothetical protein